MRGETEQQSLFTGPDGVNYNGQPGLNSPGGWSMSPKLKRSGRPACHKLVCLPMAVLQRPSTATRGGPELWVSTAPVATKFCPDWISLFFLHPFTHTTFHRNSQQPQHGRMSMARYCAGKVCGGLLDLLRRSRRGRPHGLLLASHGAAASKCWAVMTRLCFPSLLFSPSLLVGLNPQSVSLQPSASLDLVWRC